MGRADGPPTLGRACYDARRRARGKSRRAEPSVMARSVATPVEEAPQ
jgi:hypothetical protein